MASDIGGGGGDQPGQRRDELARFGEVTLIVGVVGEPAGDGGGAHQVHRYGIDDLHCGNIRDVARGTIRSVRRINVPVLMFDKGSPAGIFIDISERTVMNETVAHRSILC